MDLAPESPLVKNGPARTGSIANPVYGGGSHLDRYSPARTRPDPLDLIGDRASDGENNPNFSWANTNGGMVSSVDLLDEDEEGSDGEYASYSLIGEKFDIGSFSTTNLDDGPPGGGGDADVGRGGQNRQAFADGKRERTEIQVHRYLILIAINVRPMLMAFMFLVKISPHL